LLIILPKRRAKSATIPSEAGGPTISRLVTEAASLVRVEVGDLDQVDLLVKSFPMHLRVILILSYAFSLWMMVDAYRRGAAYFWFPVICFPSARGLLFLHQNQRL